jgi:hypothetical protein
VESPVRKAAASLKKMCDLNFPHMEKSVDCTWRQCPNHKPQMSIVYSINGEKKNVQYKIINPTKKSAMPHEIGKSPFRWIFPAKSTKLHV